LFFREDEKALHEIVKETKHNKQDWNHSIQASLSRHLEPIHESNNPRKSLSVSTQKIHSPYKLDFLTTVLRKNSFCKEVKKVLLKKNIYFSCKINSKIILQDFLTTVPRKSASAESVDYVGGESTGRNRILKWLGFTSSEPANDQQSPKKSPKRRMSTFT
uniref:DEP domain-containing protein n=1 Tax=Thelazia callipaeda TaxID=103827 RepID=A0A0N5D5A7_THECL